MPNKHSQMMHDVAECSREERIDGDEENGCVYIDHKRMTEAAGALETAEAALRITESALMFYAAPDTYMQPRITGVLGGCKRGGKKPIEKDKGVGARRAIDKARAALAKLNAESRGL